MRPVLSVSDAWRRTSLTPPSVSGRDDDSLVLITGGLDPPGHLLTPSVETPLRHPPLGVGASTP